MKLEFIQNKIKNMTKTLVMVFVSLMLVVSLNLQYNTKTASADEYDEKIAALQKQIEEYEEKTAKLGEEADTLRNKIQIMKNKQAKIETEIKASEAREKSLEKKITETELKIEDTKDTLGDAIANMYVADDVSTLEMLASSTSISDYIDKQEYRATVRDQLTDKIDEIKSLKKSLEEKQVEVQRVLGDQQNSQAELEKQKKEQADLLAKTENNEAKYKEYISQKESQQAQLQKEQQEAIEAAMRAAARRAGANASYNISAGDGTSGGYPWNNGCTVGVDALSRGGVDGLGGDPWGYGCRQCVSYAAWKTYSVTGYIPKNWGNANNWPASASAAGFKTGYTPKAKSLGVISAGQYGHIVYVNSYDQSSGMVHISQYNYYNAGGAGWGHYSEMTVPASTYDTYIYL